jgi:hypothetical protein
MEEPLFEKASTVRKPLRLLIAKEPARASKNRLQLKMSTSLKRVETHKVNRLVEKEIQRSGGGGDALQRSVRGLDAL